MSLNKNLLKIIDEDSNCPSGECTPIFSWSPLPQRKKLLFTEEQLIEKLSSSNSNDLYPNCDVNVWLRSCEKEIADPLKGNVNGKFPEWLCGSLIRNGPGSLKAGEDEFCHLFDSSALLHRFFIRNGQVTYQCRFLQSDIYKKNWTANRIVMNEFGTKAQVTDPCKTIFQKVAAMFSPRGDLSDNAMISVYPFGDDLYAFNEYPFIHRINSKTLETEGKVDISQHVSIVNHTSHPHVLKDESVFNIGMSFSAGGPYHNIIQFPKSENNKSQDMFKEAKIVASMPARWTFHPSYMHTWGITANYYIIVEQPLSLSVPLILTSKFRNEPLAGCFRWYHNEYTQINLVSRQTGECVYKFYSQSFFFLHIINQYEISDHVVLDICIYRDPAMLDCMYVETMKSMQKNPDYAKMFRGRPARFVLPLKPPPMNKFVNINLVKLKSTKAKAYYLENGDVFVTPEKLCNLGCETPRINYEKCLGKKYRYFYAISSDVDADNPGTLIKVDTENKSVRTWCETNCYPSEPIFVSSPDPKSEDDGVVLAAMVWGGDDTNHVGLIALDGKSFMEIARAEFQTPGPVPKCLHGWYLPNKE